MIKLREKDIEKLAILLELPQYAVEKMATMQLIDEKAAVNRLIAYDWKKLKARRKFSTRHIVQALEDEYQVGKGKVLGAVYEKRKCVYSCVKCGKRITKAESLRNKGICDRCVSKSIVL